MAGLPTFEHGALARYGQRAVVSCVRVSHVIAKGCGETSLNKLRERQDGSKTLSPLSIPIGIDDRIGNHQGHPVIKILAHRIIGISTIGLAQHYQLTKGRTSCESRCHHWHGAKLTVCSADDERLETGASLEGIVESIDDTHGDGVLTVNVNAHIRRREDDLLQRGTSCEHTIGIKRGQRSWNDDALQTATAAESTHMDRCDTLWNHDLLNALTILKCLTSDSLQRILRTTVIDDSWQMQFFSFKLAAVLHRCQIFIRP